MKTAELDNLSFAPVESSKMKDPCTHVYGKDHSPVFTRWFSIKLPFHKDILMHINEHSLTQTHTQF